jgi:hypothetical protein
LRAAEARRQAEEAAQEAQAQRQLEAEARRRAEAEVGRLRQEIEKLCRQSRRS